VWSGRPHREPTAHAATRPKARLPGSRIATRSARAAKLRACGEAQLLKCHGIEALQLVRDVLGTGMTIESASAARGDTGKVRVSWWGGLFRRALRCMAVTFGYATAHAYLGAMTPPKKSCRHSGPSWLVSS
jgi:hypothetical protein